LKYLIQRFGFYLIAFWAAITVNFFLPRLLPGDPAAAILGGGGAAALDPEQVRALREALGLSDAPLLLQYLIYLGRVLRFDFGTSFSFFPASVSQVIGTGFVWTILLGVTAVTISFVLGNILGVIASWRRGGIIDNLMPPVLIFIGAFPAFFLALMAFFYLANQWGLFPTGHAYADTLSPGFNLAFIGSVIRHLILPASVLVLATMGGWAIGMRNVMISVLAEDYITMAEAKGLKQDRIMFMYAARNALLPAITSFGIALGFILGGLILIEQIFSYPGLGFLLIRSVTSLDYPLMQGLFLNITLAVLIANFVVDILYTRLDPRVRGG
jgi:peptide/nickel transport system permease protein